MISMTFIPVIYTDSLYLNREYLPGFAGIPLVSNTIVRMSVHE